MDYVFYTTYPDTDSFKRRLATFPTTATDDTNHTLAGAGFSYKGSSDKVECDHCGLTVSMATQLNNALQEHRTNKPNCSFVSKYSKSGNTRPAKHPEYRELEARLDSFVSWPGKFVPQTPERLAAAGFYYIGSADRVTCFQCGVTLRDWEEDHNPEAEHRNYSSDCTFINKTNLSQLGVATRWQRNSLSSSPGTSDEDDIEEDSIGVAASSNRDDLCADTVGLATASSFNRDELVTDFVGVTVADEGSVAHTEAGGATADAVKAAKAMGFSDALIDKARTLLRQKHNRDCQNVPEFVETILELENTVSHTEKKVSKKSSSYTTACQGSTADNNQASVLMNHVQSNHPVKVVQTPKTTTKIPPLVVENKRLLDKKTCKVCRQRDVCVLFLPCGHLVTCGTCADKVDACIVCNKSILGTVKTYLT